MKQTVAFRAVGATVVVGLAAILCAGALAAGSIQRGKYKGPVTGSTTEKVTFKVSGSTVTNVKVTPYVPNKCGSGGAPPLESSLPATIKGSKFKAKLSEETSNGLVSGTATVTGRFLAGGKVKGLIENPLPGAKECAGNFPYTAILAKGSSGR
jgi:hypothetical protein